MMAQDTGRAGAARSTTNVVDLQAAALTQRVEQHLPLVRHIVFQLAVHYPRHVDRDELARAGALGLVEASQRYDEARGVPFDCFAARRIRGAILDAVRAADWAPRSVRMLSRRLEAVEQELASRLGRIPSTNELAAALDMPVGELLTQQDRVFRSVVLALEHVIGEEVDEEITLGDTLDDRTQMEPAEELELRELRAYLRDALELLPDRHRTVVVGYFLENRTSIELAQMFGVTESRVSQMRSEALTMMREGIEAQYRVQPEAGALLPPAGRVARRKAGYAEAIAAASGWRNRLEELSGSTVRLAG